MSGDWASEYLQMIEDCENRESQLTDWDRTFLDSIAAQIDKKKSISQKQIETLENIWERVTAKG